MAQHTVADLVVELLLVVQALSGHPAPAVPPEVAFVPHAVIQHDACDRPCAVYGWFPRGRTIYLDDRLHPTEDTWARSILLHELVHYAQQEAGAFANQPGCEAWSRREREAYQVQFQWLLANRAFAVLRRSRPRVPVRLACRE